MALAVMSGSFGKSSWFFVALIALAGCRSSGRLVVESSGVAEMCELEVADSHFPRVKFFYQHIEVSGARKYECSLLVGNVMSIESDMRAELEPWCREKIASSMTASSRCNNTVYEHPASEIRLSESIESEEGEGAVYLLEGQVRSSRRDS
jgi:hypothetical protein